LFLETALLTILFFGTAMAAMAVGVVVKGRALSSSCGGANEELSCGSCAKKATDLCPSDEPLVRLAQISHPDPAHHR